MSGKKSLVENIDTKFVNNLVKLMEQAQRLGVESICIGDIDIKFDSSKKTFENETAQHIVAEGIIVEDQYNQTPDESFINEEIDINEMEGEVRMMNDPLVFEKELFGENQETLNIGAVTTL